MLVTRSVLDDLLPETRKLWAKDLDVAQTMDLIQNLKLTMQNLWNSLENYYENCYKKEKKLAEKVKTNTNHLKLTWQNFAHAFHKYTFQISQFKTPKNIFVFP